MKPQDLLDSLSDLHALVRPLADAVPVELEIADARGNLATYGLAELQPVRRWSVAHERGHVYVVASDGLGEQTPGRPTCTCPDWRYRHAEAPESEGCKHIRALRDAGLLPAAAEA